MKPVYFVLKEVKEVLHRDSLFEFGGHSYVVEDKTHTHPSAKVSAENLSLETGLPHIVVKSTVSYQVPKPDLIVTEYDEF